MFYIYVCYTKVHVYYWTDFVVRVQAFVLINLAYSEGPKCDCFLVPPLKPIFICNPVLLLLQGGVPIHCTLALKSFKPCLIFHLYPSSQPYNMPHPVSQYMYRAPSILWLDLSEHFMSKFISYKLHHFCKTSSSNFLCYADWIFPHFQYRGKAVPILF